MKIYQVFLDSIVGDDKFNKITENIMYYKNLKIDVILLCPIFSSPFKDAGYDVDDYYNINKSFGDFNSFNEMIRVSKLNDIKIYLDIPINHTSDQHVWFKKALGDNNLDNYYIVNSGNEDNLPNNWLSSRTQASVWSKFNDDNMYLHIYSKYQPDLNWQNHLLQAEMKCVLKFWLGYGVSGFRLDVIAKLYKDFSVDYDVLTIADSNFNHQVQTFEYIKDLTKDLDCDFIGQVGGASKSQVASYVDSGISKTLLFDQVDFNKDEIYNKITNTPEAFLESFNKVLKQKSNVLFFESHDLPRSVDNFFDGLSKLDTFRLLNILLLTSNHDIIIYQGQEQATSNRDFKSIDEIKDERSHLFYEKRILTQDKNLVLSDIFRFTRDQARQDFVYEQNEFYFILLELINAYEGILIKEIILDNTHIKLVFENSDLNISFKFNN